MNLTAQPLQSSTGHARASAALEALPASRTVGFGQLLKTAISHEPPATPPLPAIRAPLPLQRPLFLMTPEQQRPALLAPDFIAAPAALEKMPSRSRMI